MNGPTSPFDDQLEHEGRDGCGAILFAIVASGALYVLAAILRHALWS